MTQLTVAITAERADPKTRHNDLLNAMATHRDENTALRTLVINQQPPQIRNSTSVVETIPYLEGKIKTTLEGSLIMLFELRLQRH